MSLPALPDPTKAFSSLLLKGETALLYRENEDPQSITGTAPSMDLSPPQRLQAMRQLLRPGENLCVNRTNGEVEWLTSEFSSGPAPSQPVQVNILANSRTYNVHQTGLVNRVDTVERDLRQVEETDRWRAENPELYASLKALNDSVDDSKGLRPLLGCLASMGAGIGVYALLQEYTPLSALYSTPIAVGAIVFLFAGQGHIFRSQTRSRLQKPLTGILARHSISAELLLTQIEDDEKFKHVAGALRVRVVEAQ